MAKVNASGKMKRKSASMNSISSAVVTVIEIAYHGALVLTSGKHPKG
jgi:hypothetical protein